MSGAPLLMAGLASTLFVATEAFHGQLAAIRLYNADLAGQFPGNSSDLVETWTNFNPSGTPWSGDTDRDMVDTYPNALADIFYASGDITFDGNNMAVTTSIEGVVVCGGNVVIKQQATPEIIYDNTAPQDLPAGFGPGDSSSIVPDTWRQTASPSPQDS